MQKIVVIEDSALMRARLVSLLHSKGYLNTEEYASADDIARNPEQYLQGACLIIADVQLPGISGIDLAKKLKKNSKFAGIPVFLVSGCGDPKMIAADRTGAADYLAKPFENAVFYEKVKNLLDCVNEIPAEYLLGDDEFTDAVLEEYQRASRGSQHLSLLKLKLGRTDIAKCIHQIRAMLRRTDTCCIYNNNVVLILPMTNESGAAVVLARTEALLAECGIAIPESGMFTYAGDNEVTTGEFISAVLEFVR